MRPTLTVASSLTPHEHWLSNVSMPAWMVPGMIHLVVTEIAMAAGENEPVTGVAVVIRAPTRRGESQRTR